jgi:hypothetical protein
MESNTVESNTPVTSHDTIRVRPEVVTLTEEFHVLKISDIPSNVWVLRLPQPLTLEHLREAGIVKCYIHACTEKTAKAMLPEDTEWIMDAIKQVEAKARCKYPVIAKHINVHIAVGISFGTFSRKFGNFGDKPHYVADLPRLIESLYNCGFTDIPLRSFILFINGTMPVHFIRKFDAFVAAQFGNKQYDAYNHDQLAKMIEDNVALQKLRANICETGTATAKFSTCKIRKQ